MLSIESGNQPEALSGAGDGKRNGDTAESGDGLSHEQDQQILESDNMKVTYDPEVDVLRILFRDVPIEESDEDKPGVILDYDTAGSRWSVRVKGATAG